MNVVYLDELDLSGVPFLAKRSAYDRPLTIAQTVYDRGVGAAAWAEGRFLLHGKAISFSAEVGVSGNYAPLGSVTFEAWVDGKRAWQSPLRRGGYPPLPFSVDLRGAEELILLVTDAEDGVWSDYVTWGNAKFWLPPKAETRPQSAPMMHADPELAPFDDQEHTGPTRTAEERISCLTPPMGWHSHGADQVTQQAMLQGARGLVKTGLVRAGYCYVVADNNSFGWFGSRAPDGAMRLSHGFLDMAAMVRDIHSLGLFAGIVTSAGEAVIGQGHGSFGHEKADARQFVEWGFDLIEHHLEHYPLRHAERPALYTEPFGRMARELRAAARAAHRPPLLYSIHTDGSHQPWKWARQLGAQMWSTVPRESILDWGTATQFARLQDMIAGSAGPGGWNDAGLLAVGDIGAEPWAELTRREQVAHMTQRIIWRSPLFINCDPEKIDDFALRVLGNPEALAINQDPLAAPPRMLRPHIYHSQRWIRPLANGDWAVAIINRGPVAVDAPIPLGEQGIPRRVVARDCWRRQDIGEFSDVIGCRVEPHEGILLRLRSSR